MADKVTFMLLKVDLQCSCCYKKVKKLLCKFPQIRDQVYDEKQNTVTITVVCCSPEKVHDKLCCKGGKVIKSIDIIKPPKEPEKPKPPPPEKPKPPPLVPCPPQLASPMILIVTGHGCPSIFPPEACCGPCSEGRGGGPCYQGYGRVPSEACCGPCSEDQGGGPCYQGHGRAPSEACCGPCSEGRGGGPCYQGYDNNCNIINYYGYSNYGYGSYGGRRPCYVSPCDYYEESTAACTIM